MLGLATCFGLFVSTFHGQLQMRALEIDPTSAAGPMAGPEIALPVVDPGMFNSQQVIRWVAWAWLAGVLGMLIRFGAFSYQTHRLKTRMVSDACPEWQGAFRKLLSQLGLPKGIKLLQSGLVTSPMVVGCLQPVVLVPLSAFIALTPTQLRAILLHELAHIRRYDHWANLFQNIVEALLFYHPVVWWLSSQARVEREFCCDEIATQKLSQPRDLAKALYQLEAFRAGQNFALPASGGSLKDRILRIIHLSEPTDLKTRRYGIMKSKNLGTLCATLFLTGGLLIANAGEYLSKEEFKAKKEEIKAAIENGKVDKDKGKAKIKELKAAYKKGGEQTQGNREVELKSLETKLRAAVEAKAVREVEAHREATEARAKHIQAEARKKLAHLRKNVEQTTLQLKRAAIERKISKEHAEHKIREMHQAAARESEKLGHELHREHLRLNLENKAAEFRALVRAGKMKEKEAQAKLECMRKNAEKNLEAQRRGAEKQHPKQTQGERRGETSSDAKNDKFYQAKKQIEQAVKYGKLSHEDGQKKLMAIQKQLWPDQGKTDNKDHPCSEKSCEEFAAEGKETKALYQQLENGLKAAVKLGKLSEKEAKHRLERFKK